MESDHSPTSSGSGGANGGGRTTSESLEEILQRHVYRFGAEETFDSFDSMIREAADAAWTLRQMDISGALIEDVVGAKVTLDEMLEVAIGNLAARVSNRQMSYLWLIHLEYLQFESKYERAGRVAAKVRASKGLSEAEETSEYFRVYKILSKLYSGDSDKRAIAFGELVELTSDLGAVGRLSSKINHRILKAAWHATEFSELIGAPELLERRAKAMIGLDMADSNVYFRLSRALLMKGLFGEARDAIAKAIQLSTSPELTSQYLVESSLIVSVDAAVRAERARMEEISRRTEGDLRSKLDSLIHDAAGRMSQRIDSALVFNLQILSIVIGAIAIGGTAWGVGSRLADIYREEGNDLSILEVVGLWSALTATTTAFAGILLWVVWRLVGSSGRSEDRTSLGGPAGHERSS